jgi:hypothetical protein
MIIVIPTFKREDNQKAYNLLPPEIQKKVILATHSGRGDLLKQANPTANVHEFEGELFIPEVRQSCMELGDKVLIIDDQCVFMKRVYEEDKVKHVKLSEASEYIAMFDEIEKELDNYFWVGPSPKSSNTLHKESRSEIIRSYSCYGINSKMIQKEGVRFTTLEDENSQAKVLEDFYMLLSMFSKGYKNLMLHDWVFDHKHGTKGGNSISRDNSVQEQSQKQLMKHFPTIVAQYLKANPSWVAEEGSKTRMEVRVSWKKAYMLSQYNSLESFF